MHNTDAVCYALLTFIFLEIAQRSRQLEFRTMVPLIAESISHRESQKKNCCFK
jgi:hypothetical protein